MTNTVLASTSHQDSILYPIGAQGYLTSEDVESGLVPMCLGNETRIEECPLIVGSGGKVNVRCQPLGKQK